MLNTKGIFNSLAFIFYKKKKMNKKGQLVWDQLIPWIIAIGVLVLALVLFFILSGKGESAIDYIKGLFRF
jgi:hypothetical protein